MESARLIWLRVVPQGGHAFIPVAGGKADAGELREAMIDASGVHPRFVRVRQLGKCQEEAAR